MAPQVTTNLSGQNEVEINGRRYLVQTNGFGENFVVIDGKSYNLNDPILSFKEESYYVYKKLDESFEERKGFHEQWKEKWEGLCENASERYSNAVELGRKFGKAVTYASHKLKEITGGQEFSELDNKTQQEAEVWRTELCSAETQELAAHRQRIMAGSDSSFYGRLAANEASNILDYEYMQAIAHKMNQIT